MGEGGPGEASRGADVPRWAVMAMVVGFLLTSWGSSAAPQSAWDVRGPVEHEVRMRIAQLERFLFAVDERVLEAEPVTAQAADAKESPVIRAAIEGAVRSDDAPPYATVGVYQDIDADEVEVPFVLLGRAAGDGAKLAPPIPLDVLWDELTHADRTGGTTSLVWFSPEDGGGVRLNLAGTSMHEDTQTSHARLRLIHVSMAFETDLPTPIVVRCDIVGDEAQDEPRPTAVTDADPSGRAGVEILRPIDMPRVRWPTASDVARATAYGARGPFPWRNIGRLVFMLGLVGLVLARLRDGERAKARATATSPDAPSSPAPEADEAPSPDR